MTRVAKSIVFLCWFIIKIASKKTMYSVNPAVHWPSVWRDSVCVSVSVSLIKSCTKMNWLWMYSSHWLASKNDGKLWFVRFIFRFFFFLRNLCKSNCWRLFFCYFLMFFFLLKRELWLYKIVSSLHFFSFILFPQNHNLQSVFMVIHTQ